MYVCVWLLDILKYPIAVLLIDVNHCSSLRIHNFSVTSTNTASGEREKGKKTDPSCPQKCSESENKHCTDFLSLRSTSELALCTREAVMFYAYIMPAGMTFVVLLPHFCVRFVAVNIFNIYSRETFLFTYNGCSIRRSNQIAHYSILY